MLRLAAVVTALLAAVLCAPAGDPAPKRLLIIGGGPDGHPAGAHEYRLGIKILTRLLEKTPGLQVTVTDAEGPWREGPQLLAKADGALLFLAEGAKWLPSDPRRQTAFEELAKRGGGLVALHWAMGAREAKYIEAFVNLFGGCHGGPDRKPKTFQTDLFVAEPRHPIATGIGNLEIYDEFYYNLKFTKAEGLHPVLKVKVDGQEETVAWAWERPGGGRSFGFSGLHFHKHWDLPEYRRLVVQSILWIMKLPIPKGGVNVQLGEK